MGENGENGGKGERERERERDRERETEKHRERERVRVDREGVKRGGTVSICGFEVCRQNAGVALAAIHCAAVVPQAQTHNVCAANTRSQHTI